MAKKITIRCPYCKFEYLPAEIFYADSFLGEPKDIRRDEEGNILIYKGTDMNVNEKFYCYKCGKQFGVSANITFKVNPLIDVFDEDEEEFKGFSPK